MKVVIILIIQIQLYNLNYLSRLLYFFLSHGISLHKQQKKRWTQNNSFVHATWLLLRLLWLVETKLKNRRVNHVLTLFFILKSLDICILLLTYIGLSLSSKIFCCVKSDKKFIRGEETLVVLSPLPVSMSVSIYRHVSIDLISSKHVTLLL